MEHEVPLRKLFSDYFREECRSVVQLPQAGSDRLYFRLESEHHSAIGTYGKDAEENATFLHHTRHFRKAGIAVPEIYAASETQEYYLQQDLGNHSLYQLIQKDGISVEVQTYLQEVLKQLAILQIKGAENFDFTKCYPIQQFDRSSMFWDMNSFKYYFVRVARVHFDEVKLNRDFHTLSQYLLQEEQLHFMFRDCQSRNIMLHQGKPYFIDYQGGRKGALQYDAASLLWQAGARIPYHLRDELFDYYTEEVARLTAIDKAIFKQRYYGFVLIRILQVLGAYGFRGLIEKRPHFIESIVPALENAVWFMENIPLSVELPELYNVLRQLAVSELFVLKKWDGSNLPLQIQVNSFSYKRGIPEDTSGNGGGFVFDCRGLHNPGRYEAYKQLTGKDKEVIEFLETRSRIKEFLENAYKLVDVNVQDYLDRNFSSLQINFGCTGGQHRSVYCAEKMADYLRKTYKVKVTVKHIEREYNGQYI